MSRLGPEPKVSPFTISEIGEPGSLVAVADFTCPKCSGHSRFFAHHQAEDGSFTCTHCSLVIEIRGTRLSDYQIQLDAINRSLGDFASGVTAKVQKAADRLGKTVEAPSDSKAQSSCGCGHDHGNHDHGKHGHH